MDSRVQSQGSAEGICGILTAPHIVIGTSLFSVSHRSFSYHHSNPNYRCVQKSRAPVTRWNFYAVVLNICGSLLWKLLHVTFRAPRILRWLLDFCIISSCIITSNIISTSVFLVSHYVFCGWYPTVILFEAAVPRI